MLSAVFHKEKKLLWTNGSKKKFLVTLSSLLLYSVYNSNYVRRERNAQIKCIYIYPLLIRVNVYFARC